MNATENTTKDTTQINPLRQALAHIGMALGGFVFLGSFLLCIEKIGMGDAAIALISHPQFSLGLLVGWMTYMTYLLIVGTVISAKDGQKLGLSKYSWVEPVKLMIGTFLFLPSMSGQLSLATQALMGIIHMGKAF